MTFIRLTATTWLSPATSMLITDTGVGTPLTIAVNGTTQVIPMPQADIVRARLNHNPVIVPPSPAEQGLIDAGVEFWDGKRTGM